MNLIKILSLLTLLISAIENTCFGQQVYASTLDKDSKNVIHGNIGFIPVWFAISGAYERRILKTDNSLLNTLWAKVGGGYWAQFDSGGPYALAGLTALSGRAKNHLEVSLGFVSLYDYSDYKRDLESYRIVGNVEPQRADFIENSIAGGIGYRFQNPDNGFIFRVGVSFPEAIYLGLGFSF